MCQLKRLQLTQEQAKSAAEACRRLLTKHFGAKRVILFGSLAGQGPWHDRSDVDLAVEGLPSANFFPAYSACRDLLRPVGLDLDLVTLENAAPEMRARILGEVPMPEDPMLALQAILTDELTSLSRIVATTKEAMATITMPPSQFAMHGLASYLHQFYTGIESIFERIAIYLGEGLPRGGQWHNDLLTQMATPQAGKRPAIIDEPLHIRLKDYLDFRHFFRHAYGYTLEWDKLGPKIEAMAETLARLRAQLQAFFVGLGVA
jgi:predicted nucleotidyltransferase